jgi:hypothetical protein
MYVMAMAMAMAMAIASMAIHVAMYGNNMSMA